MKTILVSLVSEQTIPNILVAIHYKPDIFWFVSTQRMEDEHKTECIKGALKLRELSVSDENSKRIVVDQDSLIDCMAKIDDLIENSGGEAEYVVNLTGGNKIMALAAIEVFREIGQKVTVGYMPLHRNEFVQIFPRKKPPKIQDIGIRLNLKQYLASYGFAVDNVDARRATAFRSRAGRDHSVWILNNYEQIRHLLSFLYKHLKEARNKNRKKYSFAEQFDRDLEANERELLLSLGFQVTEKAITKELVKDEIRYLTGGWLEEDVFDQVNDLKKQGIIDDVMMGVSIQNIEGARNELDVAFMNNNAFYHIECKTLGEDSSKLVINDELYKKSAISTLLGKGQKRAYICTTQAALTGAIQTRAKSFDIEVLSIDRVRKFGSILRERFGPKAL